ncbi:hypothetical protein [Mycolicibacterium sp. A43C]
MPSTDERSESPSEAEQSAERPRVRTGDVRRAAQRCPCGLELSLTGICVNCD